IGKHLEHVGFGFAFGFVRRKRAVDARRGPTLAPFRLDFAMIVTRHSNALLWGRLSGGKRPACLVPDRAETKLTRARQDRVFDLNLRIRIDGRIAPGPVRLLLTEDRDVERIGPETRVEDIDRRLEALVRRRRIGIPISDDDAAER